RARDVVPRPERRADADRDRLHPDVRVDGAPDELLLEQRHGARLERADAPHLDEQLLEGRDVGRDGGRDHYAASAMTAIVSPTRISSPSTARIDSSTPSTGASTACVAFSASTSTTTSPAETLSPSRLSH